MRRGALALALAVAGVNAPAALAQSPPRAPRLVTERTAYDHRAPADASTDEALRWIPRSLLAPLLGITELRRVAMRALLEPMGAPSSSPDAGEPTRRPLIALPVLMLETDRSPAAGVFVAVNASEALRFDLTAQHWDEQRVEGWLRARIALAPDVAVALRGYGSTRADRIYHGVGPDTRERDRSLFTHHQGGGRLVLRHRFFESSALALRARATHHRFGPSDRGDDPSIDAQLDPDALPAGFVEGATVLEERVAWTLDSRTDPRRAASPGARVRVAALHGADLEGDARWVRADADAALTVTLAPEHDLTIGAWGAALEPLGATPPPFVELVTLGGQPGRLAGFLRGRLLGRSAAVAHLRYRWGIDVALDAALHVEVGNAFGPTFEDLDPEHARLSLGISVDSLADDAHRVGVLVACATDPFAQGTSVSAGHVSVFIGSPPR